MTVALQRNGALLLPAVTPYVPGVPGRSRVLRLFPKGSFDVAFGARVVDSLSRLERLGLSVEELTDIVVRPDGGLYRLAVRTPTAGSCPCEPTARSNAASATAATAGSNTSSTTLRSSRMAPSRVHYLEGEADTSLARGRRRPRSRCRPRQVVRASVSPPADGSPASSMRRRPAPRPLLEQCHWLPGLLHCARAASAPAADRPSTQDAARRPLASPTDADRPEPDRRDGRPRAE